MDEGLVNPTPLPVLLLMHIVLLCSQVATLYEKHQLKQRDFGSRLRQSVNELSKMFKAQERVGTQ